MDELVINKNTNDNSSWISISTASELLNRSVKTIKDYCRTGKFICKVLKQGRQLEYLIKLDCLPQYAQDKYCGNDCSENYSDAPEWAKQQAEKYIPLISATKNLKGTKLQEFICKWNSMHSLEEKTTYSSLMRMKSRFFRHGVNGLLANYGNRAGKSIVNDDYFDYFKNLYLIEGAPSASSCWDMTFGYAKRLNNSILKEEFPNVKTFMRRLEREIPTQSIYLARYGQSAWNRKYGGYIERDYSKITCGKVWVSDHAQIDVACFTDEGTVVFPWVTVWRDYKSGKWLGWLLQTGNPNSDHIFQTFYYSASKYGLPEDVIIDNGKDYRSKDFAGGRNHFKVDINEGRANSMLNELNVNVHFALPYNAQTKPVERDFLKIKELLSKHCVGYRGGNVVERPEKLAKEIKQGKIVTFADFKKIFDDFITNILNKRPSQGKNLQGLSPDELFNQEFTEIITPSKDALKLFCMRTSRNFTIGRNGIKDNSLGITYWNDWLISYTGEKVYLRRDIKNYKEAWVFKLDNDEFIGKVSAVKAVAALHADKISKEEFKEAMSIKKRNLKIAKEYIKQTREISLEEQCENYKYAYATLEKEYNKPQISKMANTNMDKAVRKNKEMESRGTQDLSMFLAESKVQEHPLYLFETDKIIEEKMKEVANGY